jgi:phosphohistidine swiveling domain-containing protein
MAAAWVLIDHYDALPEKPDFFHRLLEIRTNTDYYLPAVDAVLRLTIAQNLSLSAEEAKVVSLHELSRREAPSQKEITERIRYALVDHTGIHTGEGAVRLKQTFNIKHPEASNKRELKGRVACKGNYTGTAKVVLRTDDTQKMDKGDVLIASTTTPDWMYAIKLAGAIVTDEGGIISHAAIVSRELGIPCIIGTKSATTNIKDGDIVTIDTETGTITW